MFSFSVPLFVSLSLCLCTEVFVNFHLCKNIIILGVRCLVIQQHLTVILKTLLHLCSFIEKMCQNVPIKLYPSFFYADDHSDCTQCFSHMIVVIQLVAESAPKPLQCRLAQEKYSIGDSLSIRAFPASCSFNCYLHHNIAICYYITMT